MSLEPSLMSRTTVKDKAQHAVILDKATSDKLHKDVQSYRLVTVAVLVDRLKINGSLARRCLADLEEKGLIKKVVAHSKLSIYSMSFHEPGRESRSWEWVTDIIRYSSCGRCCRIKESYLFFTNDVTTKPSFELTGWSMEPIRDMGLGIRNGHGTFFFGVATKSNCF